VNTCEIYIEGLAAFQPIPVHAKDILYMIDKMLEKQSAQCYCLSSDMHLHNPPKHLIAPFARLIIAKTGTTC
jgi:hypothetical protein